MQGKSNKAFSSNIKTEMNSGKPQNQALAIAYATKRRMQKKAMGGSITNEKLHPHFEPAHHTKMMGDKMVPAYDDGGGVSKIIPMIMSLLNKGGMAKNIMAKKYAKGGAVSNSDNESDQMGWSGPQFSYNRVYNEGGEVPEESESEMESPLKEDDNFLSDEEQTPLNSQHIPDPEDEKEMKKNRISKIMSELHSKHYGT